MHLYLAMVKIETLACLAKPSDSYFNRYLRVEGNKLVDSGFISVKHASNSDKDYTVKLFQNKQNK